jgi:hypothetical protein
VKRKSVVRPAVAESYGAAGQAHDRQGEKRIQGKANSFEGIVADPKMLRYGFDIFKHSKIEIMTSNL